MNNDNQISSLANQNVQMTAKEFGAKTRSKREIYRFLQSEVLAYLGEYQTMTVWHLRDIVAGDRQLIRAS